MLHSREHVKFSSLSGGRPTVELLEERQLLSAAPSAVLRDGVLRVRGTDGDDSVNGGRGRDRDHGGAGADDFARHDAAAEIDDRGTDDQHSGLDDGPSHDANDDNGGTTAAGGEAADDPTTHDLGDDHGSGPHR